MLMLEWTPCGCRRLLIEKRRSGKIVGSESLLLSGRVSVSAVKRLLDHKE